MPNDRWDQQDPLPRASRRPPKSQIALGNETHFIIAELSDDVLRFDKDGKRVPRSKRK